MEVDFPDGFSNNTHMKILIGMAKLRTIGHITPSYRLVQIASAYLNSPSGFRSYTGNLAKWKFTKKHGKGETLRFELTKLGQRAVGDPPPFDLVEFHDSIKSDLPFHRQLAIFDKLAVGANGVSFPKSVLCEEMCDNPDKDAGFVKLLGNMRSKKWIEDVPGTDELIRLTAICFPTTGQNL